jgi:nicotinate-nucleotide adenylyltransferase
MRLGLFGGSFDPPHVGHQMAMLWALATARLDRLFMVPCFQHAFDKRLSPFAHRMAMAQLAAEPFGGKVEVSDVEKRLGGESRTLRTTKAILDENPGAKVAVIVGADLLGEREKWYGYDELSRLVDFVVVGRAGFSRGADVEIPQVSSTEIRARLAGGRDLAGLVPANVSDYIAAHGLYR